MKHPETTWFIEWDRCFVTDNVGFDVEREYKYNDTYKQWVGQNNYYIHIYNYKERGSEIAFYGDNKFVNDIVYIIDHYDDFKTVVRAAFELQKD